MSNFVDLRLVNQSNDINHKEFVIFQKNIATTFEELAIAWKVVKGLDVGEYHPFKYEHNLQVSMMDEYGNYTPSIDAQNGLMYQAVRTPSGDQLVQEGSASSPNEIDILNNLPTGAIAANCFRSGKLLARKYSIAPGQKAVFEFKPTIWVGAISQVEEGELMNSAILSNINTEISILGIASADIIITGGGSGANSTEFQFTLDNVKYS